ncbi:hypothetical protein ADL21_00600 [Streptomyces albus subsp. albus]|nr:hypothetical protein ADL21_00600 [Streptomyces albus subsp. albus]
MRALLDVNGLDGVSDAVRLAVLVLASRTPSETGVVEIRTSELGRWLGLSASYVASAVLPVLRRSGVVSVDTAEGEFGQDDGLACRVLPLWAAQDVVGHPLALSKKELAVLLRLLEAVMAPGWTHRDGRVSPAGLLGSRIGRGAATDRLALLLLVLEARETGRVRQCGGAVDTKRGRAAATLARLLGCTASAGERVLERLEDRGLVLRVRLRTGSGLANRSRLLVPAVAAAHGRAVVDAVREDRSQAPESESSDPDVAAGSGEAPGTERESQFIGVPVADAAGVAEPDVAATLHTDHPDAVTEVGNGAGLDGFSGYGRGGCGDLPVRAGTREDRSADDQDDARLRTAGGTDGPLRGDKPNSSSAPVSQQSEGPSPVAGRAAAENLAAHEGPGVPRTGPGRGRAAGPRGRVPRPRGDLEAVLEPVRVLWDRLGTSGARRVVEQAARRELRYAAAVVGPERAAGVLAERLTRRLAAQPGGPEAVTDPVGWLRGRGLPRSSSCTDARCDEGTLMTTGAVCERCAELRADRRRRRACVAEQVRADLPDADFQSRRLAVEQRLREVVTADLVRDEERRRQAAEAEAARTAAAQRARAEAEAADQACRARPCRQCGAPEAGGLCGVCRARNETEALLRQAVASAVAGCGCPVGSDAAARLAANAEAAMRIRVQHAYDQTRKGGGNEVTAAVTGRLTAESLLREHHQSALGALGHGSKAEAEADQARAAQRRRRHLHPTAEAAEQAADTAAQEARQRTAEHLLATRSTAWLTAQAPAPAEETALRGRAAMYAAGAAKVRAALAT